MASKELDLYDLLSDALRATIDADHEVAQRYYTILHKYAFGVEPDELKDEEKKLQTISFDFINSDGRKQTAEIPLLTLMPLPLLHISEASFEFDVEMEIDNEVSIDSSTSGESEERVVEVPIPSRQAISSLSPTRVRRKSALLKVRIPVASTTKDTSEKSTTIEKSSSTSNMKINIKMGQSDMPLGLMNILQTASNSMLISKTKEQEE